MEQSARFIEAIREEFPGFAIVDKRDDRLSRWIDRALKMVTLGGQRDYLTRYHTVLGNTLYVPDSWHATPDVERVIVLRHERVHLRQRRRYGRVLFAFLYLVPFLPLGLSYGRARLEWEAYTETLRATAELEGLEAAHSDELRRRIVGRFTGAAYGWMWPFRRQVEKWYAQVLSGLDSAGPREEKPGGRAGPRTAQGHT